jgi:prolyl-tRNA synthetase
MGALIMTHSDDNGLVLPPNLAPIQVVFIPIYRGGEELKSITNVVDPMVEALRKNGVRVKFDDRDTYKPGYKFNEHELKGVPIRIAVGPKDIEKGTVELARRDLLTKEYIPQADVASTVKALLEEIQTNLLKRAREFRDTHITEVDSYDDFKELLESKGGFLSAHWDGTPETEERIKKETKATIRCIPLDNKKESGNCVYSGKSSSQRVLFAKAY